jgi:hypothetical protein
MTKEQLIESLKIAGRYQIYSDGDGNFTLLPLTVDQVLIMVRSHSELSSAEPPKVI